MIIKILGAFDILAAIFFWLFAFFKIIPETLVLISAIYLIVKGVGFAIAHDVASFGDIIAGFVILASLGFAIPQLIVIIVTIYLLQKGVFSLM